MHTVVRLTKRGTIAIMRQTKPTRYILDAVMRPTYRSVRHGCIANIALWGETFWVEWDALPLGEKLAWLFFLNHTPALITLIELLLLKK